MNREISYGEALREAVAQAMEQDARVFVVGEGVDDSGGIFGSTKGLHLEFGADRCFDTPLSEEALTGIVNGAALCGMRPIFVHARLEFALLTMNQLLTHAAKWPAMFGSDHRMPVVVRAIVGRGWGQGAQHSQCFPSTFAHFPGIDVTTPASASDAKGLLAAALESSRPTIQIEHRQLYSSREPVEPQRYRVPIGSARVRRSGTDCSVVTFSQMVDVALEAATKLEARGIDVEVIDLRTIAPLDRAAIMESVSRTGRLVCVENGWTDFGVAAEVAASVVEADPTTLRAPVRRVGFLRTATPSAPELERAYYPDAADVEQAVIETVQGAHESAVDRVERPGTRADRTASESW